MLYVFGAAIESFGIQELVLRLQTTCDKRNAEPATDPKSRKSLLRLSLHQSQLTVNRAPVDASV